MTADYHLLEDATRPAKLLRLPYLRQNPQSLLRGQEGLAGVQTSIALTAPNFQLHTVIVDCIYVLGLFSGSYNFQFEALNQLTSKLTFRAANCTRVAAAA